MCLTRDIAISVLEDEDGGLVDLDGPVRAVSRRRVVHVGLLARAHAAVDLPHHALVEQLEQDDAGVAVQHLHPAPYVSGAWGQSSGNWVYNPYPPCFYPGRVQRRPHGHRKLYEYV